VADQRSRAVAEPVALARAADDQPRPDEFRKRSPRCSGLPRSRRNQSPGGNQLCDQRAKNETVNSDATGGFRVRYPPPPPVTQSRTTASPRGGPAPTAMRLNRSQPARTTFHLRSRRRWRRSVPANPTAYLIGGPPTVSRPRPRLQAAGGRYVHRAGPAPLLFSHRAPAMPAEPAARLVLQRWPLYPRLRARGSTSSGRLERVAGAIRPPVPLTSDFNSSSNRRRPPSCTQPAG